MRRKQRLHCNRDVQGRVATSAPAYKTAIRTPVHIATQQECALRVPPPSPLHTPGCACAWCCLCMCLVCALGKYGARVCSHVKERRYQIHLMKGILGDPCGGSFDCQLGLFCSSNGACAGGDYPACGTSCSVCVAQICAFSILEWEKMG